MENAFEAQKFCEESDGDSEDARRPSKTFKQRLRTFKAIHACRCTPVGPTDTILFYATDPGRAGSARCTGCRWPPI
eukprot:3269781-Heterocapsa_arctica.AAC.1